jgi:mono/diheme cytochrome c family protein
MRVQLGLLGAVAGVALVFTILAGSSAATGARDDDGNAINGRKVFLKANCYICHGGRGGGGMCPSLREDRPDEVDVIREGTSSGMPAFRNILTDREIADVIAYIQTLRTSREPTFTHWWETVPSQ